MLKENNVRTGFFEPAQFAAVLAHLPAEVRPVIEFAHITGWRIASEVLPLEWRPVDFDSGEVRLNAGTTKNGDGRVFPMTGALRRLLQRQDVERGDDKESHTASTVYGAWRTFFPDAALLFVHHDRKESADDTNPDQAFSGSQAWANDAQVVMHLQRQQAKVKQETKEGEPHAKSLVTLKITGSQVSDHELYDRLHLQLDADGTNWIETGPPAYRKCFRALDPALPRADRIAEVMRQCNVGKSAVYDALKGVR